MFSESFLALLLSFLTHLLLFTLPAGLIYSSRSSFNYFLFSSISAVHLQSFNIFQVHTLYTANQHIHQLEMPSLIQMLCWAPAIVSVASAQGVIQSAQGDKGSPASLPLQVDLTANDANIINLDEITTNVVNECGRTLLGGNIDIGEQTEGQLLAKTVTSVKSGSKVAVAINQVDDNGAGPYTCDMDLKGNANGFNGQTNLTVTESAAQNGVINLSVEMPADFACIGGKISRTSSKQNTNIE